MRRKILFVEDNPLFAKLGSEVLGEEFEVMAVSTWEAARTELLHRKDEYAYALLDLFFSEGTQRKEGERLLFYILQNAAVDEWKGIQKGVGCSFAKALCLAVLDESGASDPMGLTAGRFCYGEKLPFHITAEGGIKGGLLGAICHYCFDPKEADYWWPGALDSVACVTKNHKTKADREFWREQMDWIKQRLKAGNEE